MKKNQVREATRTSVARFQVDLVTRMRFSHIWHNNLFAYADRASYFESLEDAEAEAQFRNRIEGIDFAKQPETFWKVRS